MVEAIINVDSEIFCEHVERRRSSMMIIASLVPNFLLGLIIGAGYIVALAQTPNVKPNRCFAFFVCQLISSPLRIPPFPFLPLSMRFFSPLSQLSANLQQLSWN
ncbi:hypothetical protein RIF29_32409 [Crotalaria pallida]|uniref:Uncharacterized protein n=1 Tax=Crotalaria pallida TaxID=3830 RepID=A0AAN9EIP7_CROPI